jgi:GNAT superfamily N-acetyltransferase
MDPRDRAAVTAFVGRLSEDTVELRFCAPVRAAAVVDEVLEARKSDDRIAIVVESADPPGRILALGECDRRGSDRTRGEVTFVVEDGAQGRGVGSLLLQEMVRRARAEGVDRLVAVVMSENRRMRETLSRSSYPYRITRAGSSETYLLDLVTPQPVNWAGRVRD